MSDWTRYLTDTQIRAIHGAVIDAGLATDAQLDALSAGISRRFAATIPTTLPPTARLSVTLDRLNTVHNLSNGDVPLAQWLSKGIMFMGGDPRSTVLEDALRSVNDTSPAAPAHATPIGDPADANLEVIPEVMIAGADQTLSIDYLQGGVEAALSVMKLLVHRHDDGNPTMLPGNRPMFANGTGWMIGPRLLITNHHVVNSRRQWPVAEPDATPQDFELQAEHTTVLFDYFKLDSPSAKVVTGQGALLASDKALDFAILRVPAAAPTRAPLRLCKNLIIKNMQQKLGTRVNVLQHPNGNPMRLGFRDNFVVVGDAESLSYLTDTDSGSSGSPVCDDAWYAAALHSGSRSIKDKDIRIRETKVKSENFGIPIPTIMAHLKAHHAALHDEILAGQP